jgi:hypothetical protein
MSKISKIAFCPHCGNESSQVLVHSQVCEWVGRSLVDDAELNLGRTYFVASCETCNHILLYSFYGDDHADRYPEIFAESYLEYPASGNLPLSVPDSIRQVYEEATKIKLSSPNAFAVQIRRALEVLCKDRGAKGKNLNEQIKDLVSREELPATLGEAADLLRHLGNTGAHADEKSIRLSQVKALDKFFRAIVEYVYVAPSTVSALRDSWMRFQSQKGKDDGGN